MKCPKCGKKAKELSQEIWNDRKDCPMDNRIFYAFKYNCENRNCDEYNRTRGECYTGSIRDVPGFVLRIKRLVKKYNLKKIQLEGF